MPTIEEELAALKADNEKYKTQAAAHAAELEKLKTVPPKKEEEDPSLADKVRKERETTEGKVKYEKSLEAALQFNIAGKDFAKLNEGLVPKSVEGIFLQAEKEKYDSAIDRANAIKVGIISEFFAVQENHDLLTSAQKVQLEEFSKLTKNIKQERVENIYSLIFEPTLESLRKIEKARQLGTGERSQDSFEKQMIEKRINRANKHFLREN